MDAANLDNSKGLGPDGSLSHAFSTFMIMFTTQPLNVLNEMHRVLQPGKIFGLAIWGELVGPDTTLGRSISAARSYIHVTCTIRGPSCLARRA